MINKLAKILLVFFLLIIVSCNGELSISDMQEIEKGVWDIRNNIILKTNVEKVNIPYNLYVNINASEDFLTNNIWLFVKTKSPSGNIQSDTVQFFLSDATGKWFGNKNGDIIKNNFLYKTNIKFLEKGTYTFLLAHGMRNKDLPKVKSVGITIEETKSN